MKRTFLALAVGLGFTLAFIAPSAPAMAGGVIENACLKADRRSATRTLCNCVQRAADAVLSRSEQRRGAKFFAEPHLSQELRASDRSADERLWDKWKTFGATAEKYCR